MDEGDKIKHSATKEPVGLLKEVVISGDVYCSNWKPRGSD
jgi:hypothetical protein